MAKVKRLPIPKAEIVPKLFAERIDGVVGLPIPKAEIVPKQKDRKNLAVKVYLYQKLR